MVSQHKCCTYYCVPRIWIFQSRHEVLYDVLLGTDGKVVFIKIEILTERVASTPNYLRRGTKNVFIKIEMLTERAKNCIYENRNT